MGKRNERIEEAREHVATCEAIVRLGLEPSDLSWEFGLTYQQAKAILNAERLSRGEITLANLTPAERRALIDPASLDLHAIAAGPIMDSNEIFLPAGKLTAEETRAREAAALLEARRG